MFPYINCIAKIKIIITYNFNIIAARFNTNDFFFHVNEILIVHTPLKQKVTITWIMNRDIHMKW